MATYTDITGLAGVAATTVTATLTLPGITKLTTRRAGWVFAVLFVLMLLPFGTMPIAAYVRGVTGDLSITTLLILFGGFISRRFGSATDIFNRREYWLAVVAVIASVFYPCALGVGQFDPYQLGFGNIAFVLALLLCAVLSWLLRRELIALIISLALLAWAVGWYESNNLWDYLIDPFIAIYSLAMTIAAIVGKVVGARPGFLRS
jgi:hypothetical protein